MSAPTLHTNLGTAMVAEIREALAGLAGNSERDLLVKLSQFKRREGWGSMPFGGTWQSKDFLTAVDFDRETRQIRVLHRGSVDHGWPWEPMWHSVDSVRKAIDRLVELNVLPAEWSSLYAAGRADRALEVAA